MLHSSLCLSRLLGINNGHPRLRMLYFWFTSTKRNTPTLPNTTVIKPFLQEFMAGGDLKALVMSAMGMPFAPPYSKSHALSWAMQVAEALHYLHCVCRPMIIHRDLKLDNVLLSSSNLEEATVRRAWIRAFAGSRGFFVVAGLCPASSSGGFGWGQKGKESWKQRAAAGQRDAVAV
jgi:serine/threonine protein kinase